MLQLIPRNGQQLSFTTLTLLKTQFLKCR